MDSTGFRKQTPKGAPWDVFKILEKFCYMCYTNSQDGNRWQAAPFANHRRFGQPGVSPILNLASLFLWLNAIFIESIQVI
jgi:hypothetical protein